MIDIISDTRAKAVELMEKSNAAKRAGDFAKSDDFYSESLFYIKLLKAAGEDVEAIR